MRHASSGSAGSQERTPIEHEAEIRPNFPQKYWAEILAICLFGLGVFLLVEQMKIKIVIWQWLVSLYHSAVAIAKSTLAVIHSLIEHVEVSDMVGICLILAAAVVMTYGLRSRAISRSLPLTDGSGCPEEGCEGVVRRSRRNFRDRLTQGILRISVRPYTCRDCSHRAVVWTHRHGP